MSNINFLRFLNSSARSNQKLDFYDFTGIVKIGDGNFGTLSPSEITVAGGVNIPIIGRLSGSVTVTQKATSGQCIVKLTFNNANYADQNATYSTVDNGKTLEVKANIAGKNIEVRVWPDSRVWTGYRVNVQGFPSVVSYSWPLDTKKTDDEIPASVNQ